MTDKRSERGEQSLKTPMRRDIIDPYQGGCVLVAWRLDKEIVVVPVIEAFGDDQGFWYI